MSQPIELHFWPTPNGMKIAIMLEELGVPYSVRRIDIGNNEQFAPDFLAISPNNKIPAIVDPDGPGGLPVSVFESAAILMYLGRKFGRFYGSDDARARVAVEEWLVWQVASFGPMIGQLSHFNGASEKLPYAIRRYSDEARRLYGVLERRLADRAYLAGDYSLADIAIFPLAKRWEHHGIDPATHPNVAGWLGRIASRPAIAAAYARHTS